MREARLRSFLYKLMVLLMLGIALAGAGIIAIIHLNNHSGGTITNARYVMIRIGEARTL